MYINLLQNDYHKNTTTVYLIRFKQPLELPSFYGKSE